jgi:hypothetical protein
MNKTMLRELSTITQTNPALSRSGGVVPSTPSTTDQPISATPSTTPDNVASPRIKLDPAAGVILQFLDNRGDVVTQSPSFAAVAYLRAGLTREGFPQEPETESPASITA